MAFVIVTVGDENKKTLLNLDKVNCIMESGSCVFVRFSDESCEIKESIDYICKNAFSFDAE